MIACLLGLYEYLSSIFIFGLRGRLGLVIAPLALFIVLIILYYAISLFLKFRKSFQSNSAVYPSFFSDGWEKEKKLPVTDTASEHTSHTAVTAVGEGNGGGGVEATTGGAEQPSHVSMKSSTKLTDINIEDITSKVTDSPRPLIVRRPANNSSTSPSNGKDNGNGGGKEDSSPRAAEKVKVDKRERRA